MKIIAGKYYNRPLDVPKNNRTRPTTSRLRESLFNILQNEIEEVDFLDIFAGSGAIGLEALSRGARSATFIECDPQALQALKNNLKRLEIDSEALVLGGDYIKGLKGLGLKKAQFGIIFADAPYHTKIIENLLEHVVSQHLLRPLGKLFIENDEKFGEDLNLFGLKHINTRKSGKSYLHQFQQ